MAEQALLTQRNPILLEDWICQSLPQWKAHLGAQAVLKREGEPLLVKVAVDLRIIRINIENLLNNASANSQKRPPCHQSPESLKPRGIFSTHRWQIEFQDQGWGFNPADSKRIFHRFFRSRSQAPYAIPGTGLGLYLASSASKAMGLSLRGDSPGQGQGAVFILEGPERKQL